MLTYIIGAAAGLIFGGIIGLLKNIFIWQRYLQKSASSNCQETGAVDVYIRAMVSYFVNILTLVIAFFIRNVLPFDGIAFLIGTAAALVIMNKVLAFRQKKNEDTREEAYRQ